MNDIRNIVIYKSIENGKEVIKSCVFYNDGTTKEGSYDDGVAAIKKVAKEKHITTKDQLRKIMNKEIVYTMTEKEFKERYDSFLPEEEKNEEFDSERFAAAIKRLENIGKEKETEPIKEKVEVIAPVISAENKVEEKTTEPEEEKNEEVVYEEDYDSEEDEDEDNYYYSNSETEEVVEETNSKKKKGLGLKIVAGIVAIGTILGCGWALSRCSKKGVLKEIPTPTTTTTTDTTNNTNTTENTTTEEVKNIIGNNDLYNDYTYGELLNVTTNEFQKKSMVNVHSGITGFNREFANNYLESGHDIKAALSFDEVVALQQAYNNYSTDEVRAYFNGYEVDAIYMSNAYKSASLQLMGAYTIETSKNPVDMSMLIDSQEGKDFYNKYHAMFLAAKEAKGNEQLRLVKEFYAAVEKDFPITEEVRTEGISHSEDHNSLKDYQLAVAPMIASAEMIFQNLEIDYTLDDTKVDFLNDIGLCNHADDKFERLETITLTAYEDNENPLFEQYKKAIIAELIKTNDYVIDDAHRELSNLRRFQEVVNGDPNWKHKTTYEGEYNEAYTSYEETYTWEETTTEYETVTTREEKPIPDDEKAKIDAEIEKENEEAKRRAEEEAEEERRRQQAEEDEKAKEIEKEVEEENKQLEEDIKEINETIDENNKDTDKSNDKPVNENDYDHIDFDDEHSDEQGNLDNSVENVTTDGTGANEPLPDPNVTGQKFDAQMSSSTETTTTTTETTSTETTSETTTTTETTSTTTTEETTTSYTEEDMTDVYVEYAGVEGAYIEYDTDYGQYDADGNPIVTEETGHQKTR